MGASSSSPATSPEQQEEESIATSTTPLPIFHSVFSNLSATPLSSIFSTKPPKKISSSPINPPSPFPLILSSLGPTVSSLLFSSSEEKGLTWLGFLRGYNRCCARKPASASLTLILLLFSESCRHVSIPCDLSLDSEEKIVGSLTSLDLLMLLWMCWVMARCCRVRGEEEEEELVLPDLRHLVISALFSAGEIGEDEDVSEFDVVGSEKRIEAGKVQMWMIATVPGLAGCFSQYVQHKIRSIAETGDYSSLSSDAKSTEDDQDRYLLNCGTAWAISLSLRTTLSDEFRGVSFPGTRSDDFAHILYRSSLHGKGLNRFWSNVDGYHGSLLVLVSASSPVPDEINNGARRWVIGILTEQGFENKQTFYGDSAHLYAISPIFRVFSPAGREKNFMYSHLHLTGKVYEANPKPIGLAFGGTMGNERIFIHEDFSRVTVRHHAVDKTYQHGSLVPNQGFLPVEASLLEVEVWGFGGKAAREKQDVYKKRESLFSDQRRKVDLKTFGNWEDSPEKMMMDMVSNPNSVRREER